MGGINRNSLTLGLAAGLFCALPAMAASKAPIGPVPLPHTRPASAGPAAAISKAALHVPLPLARPPGAGPAAVLSKASLARVPLPHARESSPGASPGLAAARDVPLPRQRAVSPGTELPAGIKAGTADTVFASRATFQPLPHPVAGPFAIAPAPATSPADLEELRKVIAAARKGRDADVKAAEHAIQDPVARLLAEWIYLRSDNTSPSFQQYAAFVTAHPDWPHVPLFRHRAEDSLWNDGIDDATVLAFFARHPPTTAKGRFMLARALLAKGDRAGAEKLVRYAWRRQDFSADVENKARQMFGDMITREDDRVRMQQRFYVDDIGAGMREAQRLGGNDLAIARARAAVIKDLNNAKALLDDVPVAARQDPGYIFARAQWLRKHNKPDEAEQALLTAPQDAEALVDPDQWWLERRVLVRKLLDDHKPQAAYRVARDAAPPRHDNWRVDKYFTAGWIALRFLHDPKTAAEHFAHIAQGTNNPHALGRAGYWQGRAAEAMGKRAEAKAFYEKAAQYTITYYGQLARARLGIKDLGLLGSPAFTPEERAVLQNLEVVRAAEMLYALGENTMLASIYAAIGESGTDVAGMSMLEEVAAKRGDGRAMVLLGRYAHARGLPMDYYAYPTVGLPEYRPIAPPIERSVAYSIVRQESDFNQQDVSSAHAVGLMQVTPEAGRDTAHRFKVKYDFQRLAKDPVYNMQMGAAELSNDLHYYRGSYLLTFAAYNAGSGRVKQWIAAYGDPRDPKVDPIDWAERIPLAETRNYVQRVMENLQVYRARFGGGTKLLIEADLRRGAE